MGIMAFKRYADDYDTVITTDENGNEKKTAVYRGDYFEFELNKEEFARFKRNSYLLLAAIVVLHTGAGFVDNRGMYQFYIALPYVLAFFPLMYLAASILRLPKEKPKYRRDEIGLSFDRMKPTSIVLLILLVSGVLGVIAFLLFFSVGDQRVLEYLYVTLEVLAAASVLIIIRLQGKIRIKTCTEK